MQKTNIIILSDRFFSSMQTICCIFFRCVDLEQAYNYGVYGKFGNILCTKYKDSNSLTNDTGHAYIWIILHFWSQFANPHPLRKPATMQTKNSWALELPNLKRMTIQEYRLRTVKGENVRDIDVPFVS